MPAVSAMENFISNIRQYRQGVQNLFDKILTYKYEISVENPYDNYAAAPMAEWLTDVEGGIEIYFNYLEWFREPLSNGDQNNRFVLRLDHRNYDHDAFTYDIALLEMRNGHTNRAFNEEYGPLIENIDCFYAFNMFMNLIRMREDGLVDGIDVYRFHDRKLIAEEEWMRSYNQTIAVLDEWKKMRNESK